MSSVDSVGVGSIFGRTSENDLAEFHDVLELAKDKYRWLSDATPFLRSRTAAKRRADYNRD